MEHTDTDAISQAAVLLNDLRAAIGHAMVGQSAVIEQVLVALVEAVRRRTLIEHTRFLHGTH